jgi:hypothetical protein
MVFHGKFIELSCAILFWGFMPTVASMAPTVESNQWWYNFSSSPLIFKPSNSDSSYMDLVNNSGGEVSTFRFGCIHSTGNVGQVTQELDLVKLNLKAGHAYFQSSTDLEVKLRSCAHKDSKLAVAEVTFDDGGSWSVR